MAGEDGVDSLAPFFRLPCMMLDAEGAVSTYDELENLRQLNASRRDAFEAGGAVKASFRSGRAGAPARR
jgi:hypothetical protein